MLAVRSVSRTGRHSQRGAVDRISLCYLPANRGQSGRRELNTELPNRCLSAPNLLSRLKFSHVRMRCCYRIATKGLENDASRPITAHALSHSGSGTNYRCPVTLERFSVQTRIAPCGQFRGRQLGTRQNAESAPNSALDFPGSPQGHSRNRLAASSGRTWGPISALRHPLSQCSDCSDVFGSCSCSDVRSVRGFYKNPETRTLRTCVPSIHVLSGKTFGFQA